MRLNWTAELHRDRRTRDMGLALIRVHLGGRGRRRVLDLWVLSPGLFQRDVGLLVAQDFWAPDPTGKLQGVQCTEVILTQIHVCSGFVRGFWSRNCTSLVDVVLSAAQVPHLSSLIAWPSHLSVPRPSVINALHNFPHCPREPGWAVELVRWTSAGRGLI